MAGTWELFRRIAKKKWAQAEEIDRPRVDRDLPLGLRIGSMLNVTSVDAILAGDKLNIKVPTGDMNVVAYGKFRVGEFVGHRFYLSTDAEELFTLQVVTDKKGEIDECKLFSLHDEVFVTGDWDFWLNKTDGYIGYSVFDLKDGTRYFRVWDNDAEQVIISQDENEAITHIPPVEFTETINEDPFGDNIRRVRHTSMLYGRDVANNVQEYMMVSAAEDSAGSSVQIIIGLPVEPPAINVRF